MIYYSIPPFLTLSCFAGLAALAIRRGRKTRTNFLFLLICILGCLLYVDILLVLNLKSASTALLISRTDHFFVIYLIPLYVHFFHAYLNISNRKWLLTVAYIYAFILTCFTPTSLYIASMQHHFFGFFAKGGILYPCFGAAGLCTAVYILILLYRAMRLETRPRRKKMLAYVFCGFGTMGLMNSLNIFPLMGYPVYPPGNLSFIPLAVFGIGIFRHDLLEMGFSIKKSLVYSMVTALLTGFYALFVVVLGISFKDFDFFNSSLFSVCFFLLITLIFGPLKTTAQTFIDRIFYKSKIDYHKTIKHISKMIVSVLDIDQIGEQLTGTVLSALDIDNCALFSKNKADGGYINRSAQGDYKTRLGQTGIPGGSYLVKHLNGFHQPLIRQKLSQNEDHRSSGELLFEMNRLHAEIIFPLVVKAKPNGFMVIGAKRSGDCFFKEDIDLLKTLCRQSALALENALAYEEIEDLNQHLEQKVAARTLSLKEALMQKEKTQEQLVRSESLAAIGQLVAGVAHEINNPLTSVKSLIQVAIEDLSDLNSRIPIDQELINDLRFADRELERAKDIVRSLLDLSRQKQTYTEKVNLNLVLKDALSVLRNQYKNLSVDIYENLCENLPDVRGNFANLGQVAINIIQNALQAAIVTSGSIFLTTRYAEKRQRVVFECRDTGPGISDAIRSDIFKPFFTTKEVGQGTGLGLYICHEIIEKHGGKITFENHKETGATFIVSLPARAG